jgi:phosphoglycolate phosphatase
MYKLVILDFDGTLFNTKEAIHYCLRQSLIHFNYTHVSDEELKQTLNKGITLEETYKTLISPDLTAAEIARMVTYYREIYNGSAGICKTLPYPMVQETLQELHDNGCEMVVISNKGELAINNSLNHFKVANFIKLVVGNSVASGMKPKPDPMVFHEIVTKQFPVQPEDVLVVGDTPADIHFARNIGAKSCWASYGYGLVPDCQTAKPDYIIDDFQQLKKVFLRQAELL